MFSFNGSARASANPGACLVEFQAIDLKEEAQRLQREGRFEEALPLMLRSVALREESHTLCLSLSELALLYVDMLQFDKADAVSRRMLHEAHRYDGANQKKIAQANLEDSAQQREFGFAYGMAVQLEGLTVRPELNGEKGVIKGRLRGRYLVKVCSKMLSLDRSKFSVQPDPIVSYA